MRLERPESLMPRSPWREQLPISRGKGWRGWATFSTFSNYRWEPFMPVTPFHLGPGALAKSIAPRNFSFQVFFLSQIAMDIQPGINLLLGWRPLHGWTHTYLARCLWNARDVVWRIWEKIRPVVFESQS